MNKAISIVMEEGWLLLKKSTTKKRECQRWYHLSSSSSTVTVYNRVAMPPQSAAFKTTNGKSRAATSLSTNGKLESWPPIGRERTKNDSSCLRYVTEASRQDQRLVHQEKMEGAEEDEGEVLVDPRKRKKPVESIVDGSTDSRAEKDSGTVTTEKDGTGKDREREEGTGYCSERSEEQESGVPVGGRAHEHHGL